MTFDWLDRLGDWNPQLLRELKGRLKPRNLLITLAIALLGQFLLVMSFYNQLPAEPPLRSLVTQNSVTSYYCTGPQTYGVSECLRDAAGNFMINWPFWWLKIFVCLCVLISIALPVVGTYLLISDLSREENRGTLNFIRLSPRSTQSLLSGKLLGVPVLLYLLGALVLPLHGWAGLAAQVSPSLLLSFYVNLAACCLCFYSAALLYGSVSTGLGGFQAWLGSGVVLAFLSVLAAKGSVVDPPLYGLGLLSPLVMLPHLIASTGLEVIPNVYLQVPTAANPALNSVVEGLRWFHWFFGASAAGTVGLTLLNAGLWTYWLWQALLRCFRNPGVTILSKTQSYWLTAWLQGLNLGFAVRHWPSGLNAQQPLSALQGFLFLQLLLFLGLIAVLSPQRQALQDWARYRHSHSETQVPRRRSLLWDLLWGEKSPALVAIALNLAIAAAMIAVWILAWPPLANRAEGFCLLLAFAGLILIYAALTQLLLLLKARKRSLWAVGGVGAALVLPPLVLGVLSVSALEAPGVYLFLAPLLVDPAYAAASTAGLAVLGQWLVLSLLSVQLARQLRQAGASASKPLLATH